MTPKRNQSEARRIARLAYPYPGCCLCGQTVGEQLSHLDHNAGNNDPDNLAWLCHHHHWMFDIGLFSLAALKAQRTHWQAMEAHQRFHEGCRQEGRRNPRRQRHWARNGRKAVATRLANKKRQAQRK